MDVKPIKTETDYQVALKEIEALFEVKINTPEWEKLDILTTLVEAYEQKKYPIESPTPTEEILYHLESRQSGFSMFIKGLKSRGVDENLIQDVLQELTIVNS